MWGASMHLHRLPLLPHLNLLDEHRYHLREVALSELLEHLTLTSLEEDLRASESHIIARDLEGESQGLAEERRLELSDEVGHLGRVAAVDRLVRDACGVGSRH